MLTVKVVGAPTTPCPGLAATVKAMIVCVDVIAAICPSTGAAGRITFPLASVPVGAKISVLTVFPMVMTNPVVGTCKLYVWLLNVFNAAASALKLMLLVAPVGPCAIRNRSVGDGVLAVGSSDMKTGDVIPYIPQRSATKSDHPG